MSAHTSKHIEEVWRRVAFTIKKKGPAYFDSSVGGKGGGWSKRDGKNWGGMCCEHPAFWDLVCIRGVEDGANTRNEFLPLQSLCAMAAEQMMEIGKKSISLAGFLFRRRGRGRGLLLLVEEHEDL